MKRSSSLVICHSVQVAEADVGDCAAHPARLAALRGDREGGGHTCTAVGTTGVRPQDPAAMLTTRLARPFMLKISRIDVIWQRS